MIRLRQYRRNTDRRTDSPYPVRGRAKEIMISFNGVSFRSTIEVAFPSYVIPSFPARRIDSRSNEVAHNLVRQVITANHHRGTRNVGRRTRRSHASNATANCRRDESDSLEFGEAGRLFSRAAKILALFTRNPRMAQELHVCILRYFARLERLDDKWRELSKKAERPLEALANRTEQFRHVTK